jgi:hypothetical protein
MAKHIVEPATAEEMARTLRVTRKDREIVERILRELGEYDSESAKPSASFVQPPIPPIARPDKRPKKNK